MIDPHPLDLSLAEAAAALRSDALTAIDLTEAALARHGERALLDAYVHRDPATMRAQALAADAAFAAGVDHGPLQGIPVSVKDLFGVPGWPTFAGSPRPLPERFCEAGTSIRRLLQCHAVLTGKTHTVEFAFGGIGTNPHHPVPRNPWDDAVHRVPGGSSAGAGVSLHLDAMLALGTDTAGSVRIPAAMTGNVGVKTTHGRWPVDHIVPLSPSFDTVGILARSVADAAVAFAVLDGRPADALPAMRITGLRLGRCDDELWQDCSPGVAESVDAAIAALTAAGACVQRFELPQVAPALALFRVGHLAAPELQEFMASELPDWLPTLDPAVAARLADAGEMKAQEYLRRKRELARLQALADLALGDIDALVLPTVPITPPTVEHVSTLENYRQANMLALRNTAVANLLRLCAVTLPVGLDAAGMPVGLQLVMRAGQDQRLLALALACEQLLGRPRERLGRPPPIG